MPYKHDIVFSLKSLGLLTPSPPPTHSLGICPIFFLGGGPSLNYEGEKKDLYWPFSFSNSYFVENSGKIDIWFVLDQFSKSAVEHNFPPWPLWRLLLLWWSEAQKPKTFRIAAFYAQFFSGRSARIHFSRHVKKARNPLSRHTNKARNHLSRHM